MSNHRRTLLRGVAALATGGSLAGLLGSAAAAPPEPTTLHDDRLTTGAETTLTATIDPSVHGVVGVPSGIGSVMERLRSRYRSLDPARFGPVSVSAGIDGDRIAGGCALADGAFDEEEFRAELEAEGCFEDGNGDSDTVSVPGTPYAVAIGGSTLAVGYGDSETAASAHAESAVSSSRSAGGPPSVLDGDAVSYATLGSGTRSHLRDRIDTAGIGGSGAAEGFETVLAATEAVGVALSTEGSRCGVQYGAVADPESVSANDLWTLATRTADSEAHLDIESVSRHGRMIVVDATISADRLWGAHERLLGRVSAGESAHKRV